ncbi:hypothetical protein NB713_003387 [Xanthomonas sacchari]|nr:hypothetical protein [Xanthomonas sacchari]
MRLKLETKKIKDLNRAEILGYCDFMKKYDLRRSRKDILQSLRKLQKVVIGRDKGGAIVAIGTLVIKRLEVNGKSYVVIIPGTVFDPVARGRDLIRKYTIYNYFIEKAKSPFSSVVFCAVFGNWRGYRSFVGRLRNAWPSPFVTTPPDMKALMSAIFSEVYKEKWDADSGTVRNLGVILREAIDFIPDAERDPYALEFRRLNPGYPQGDGLATMCVVGIFDLLGRKRRSLR